MNIKEKLAQITSLLNPYLRHKDSCSKYLSFSNPESDYCDCGFRLNMDKATEIAAKNFVKESSMSDDFYCEIPYDLDVDDECPHCCCDREYCCWCNYYFGEEY